MGKVTKRVCKVCKEEKPLSDFPIYVTPAGRRKQRWQCKQCRVDYITARNRIKSRRICPQCKQTKQSVEFVTELSLDYKAYGKICRECAYQNNLKLRKTKKQKHFKVKSRVRRNNRKRYWDTKKSLIELFGNKCKECGKVFPWYAYDFHHQDAEEKEMKLSKYFKCGVGHLEKDKAFQEEILKCVLVCAICHRKLHLKKGEIDG